MATLFNRAPHSGLVKAASELSTGEAFETRTLCCAVTFGVISASVGEPLARVVPEFYGVTLTRSSAPLVISCFECGNRSDAVTLLK
jgi:hypothetical protein